MIIRGKNEKQAQSALGQYASHELPSVLKQKNSVPSGGSIGLQNAGREVSERGRRRLSGGANSQNLPAGNGGPDSRSEQRSQPQMVINKTNI